MLNLKDIRYVLIIAKTGSLLKTANEVGLSQPALSKRLQNLEQSLGITLFNRHPKGMQLTAEGKLFIQQSPKLLTHSQDFINSLNTYQSDRHETIKIGLTPVMEGDLSRNAIIQYTRLFPDVKIRIIVASTSSLCQQTQAGELDFIFGVSGYGDSESENESDTKRNTVFDSHGLDFNPMFRTPLGIVISQQHEQLPNIKQDTRTIYQYPMVSPMPPQWVNENLKSAYAKQSLEYKNPDIHLDDYRMAFDIVEQSNAWVAAFLENHQHLSDPSRFYTIPYLDEFKPLTIGLVTRKTWSSHRAADTLISLFKEQLAPWLIND